jgi:hypothetical protein
VKHALEKLENHIPGAPQIVPGLPLLNRGFRVGSQCAVTTYSRGTAGKNGIRRYSTALTDHKRITES